MNGGNSPRSPTVPIPTRNNTAGTTRKTFGPEGCPAMANGRRCGETRNLQIIQEFRRLYEDKMRQIDDAAGGDCVQAKINLQQEWIRDLTDQNEMLVRVVEELEVEAAERVIMLEDKLQQSAKCACEHEKQAKEKDKQIKELEEKIKKLMETNDVNGDANKACQELKKADQEKALKIEALTEENLELRVEVKLLKIHVARMRSALARREMPVQHAKRHSTRSIDSNTDDNVSKESQTASVDIIGRESLTEIVKQKEKEKALVVSLEQEIQGMLRDMNVKDIQLKEQNELITLLVRKLFCVYKTLRCVDDDSIAMLEELANNCHCFMTGDVNIELQNKYLDVIELLQQGVRKSINGIEDRSDC